MRDDLAARPSVHDDADDHEHDDFESFVLDIGEITSPEALVSKLEAAISAHNILRVKGFIAVAGKDMRMVLQGVGNRLQHYFDRDWEDGETRVSKLVIIGEHDMDYPIDNDLTCICWQPYRVGSRMDRKRLILARRRETSSFSRRQIRNYPVLQRRKNPD